MRGSWLLGIVAVGTLLAAGERSAEACGGCFHDDPPPGPTPRPPSVVTDHRMIVSLSKEQTTLYDELRYSGSPESFAGVLPIAGAATIGISSDGLFATLDAMTQVEVVPPPSNCPTPPQSCYQQYGEGDMAPSASAGASGGGGVTVTAQQTIGPYETVQLHATDGSNALPDWLTSHGYTIPDDIKPVIAAYVAEHFDFLALKLVPGTGIQAMRPVRVTTQGASVALPLRMIQAGTGANVGIVLWTVAEGRYEPQNFPSFSIKADDLVWDWTAGASNLASLRNDRMAALGGRGWEIESSVGFKTADIPGYVTNGYCPPSQYQGGGYNGGPGGGTAAGAAYACSGPQNDYDPEDGGPDGASLTKQQVQTEDLTTLLSGIGADVRITRIRSSLAHTALDQDLVLQASADQSELPSVRQVTKELNQPMCSVYQGCAVVGQAPRDEAWAKSDFSSGSETSSCAMTKPNDRGRSNALFGLGALGALVAVAAKRLRRK